MSDGEAAPRSRARRFALALLLVAIAWVWLAFRRFGDVGQILAIVGPAIYALVVVGHLGALVRRSRALTVVSLVAWLAAGTAMVVAPRVPDRTAAPRDPVTIVAANLHFQNATPAAAARDLIARRPDVVVVSEGTTRSEAALTGAFEHHLSSPPHRDGYSEYVASRFELRRRAAGSVSGQAVVVEVMAPTPFLLIAVHLPRPGLGIPLLPGHFSFARQARAVNAVRALTAASALPVVVAGDLNVSDRTSTYAHLVAHRRDAMRASWAGSTFRPFPFDLLALRIDHVIVDRTWCAAHAQRFHPRGSDHNAVQATIGPCP
ncbi:MAG TPA: endonuclease/exonuclease/phosphatase family protein [Acidimicrobiia bacterium]|nr:endonuclease/exonuclease/phosphatase family protein [Acidimicrobiia bacterium]